MKNSKSCAGFCSLVAVFTFLLVFAVVWGTYRFGDNDYAIYTIVAVVVIIFAGIVVLYYRADKKRFLAAVKKERPDALAFLATAPPNMAYPFGTSLLELERYPPGSVVFTASQDAFEIWTDKEPPAPTRSLPNTKDLEWSRGEHYMGLLITGSRQEGTYSEKELFYEAIEIRNPKGDNLIFRPKALDATWTKLEELRSSR